jgi:rSAM/selenodomain-associated transferase 1
MSARTGRALAVIAKEPVPGAVKTRLAPAVGLDGAARLAAAMLADTLDAVRPVRATRWLYFAPAAARRRMRRLAPGFRLAPQCGGDLGDRLAACVGELVAGGVGRVVVVGADTPHLPPALCDTALGLLDDVDVVLGPALDGGYYLIALRAAAPELFVGVPMGTARVLEVTLGRVRRAGLTTCLLPALRDLDRPQDVRAALLAGELVASPRTRAAAVELLATPYPADPLARRSR